MTSTVLAFFACLKLDSGDGLQVESDTTNGWWVQDTSLECYTGEHLAGAILAGVLGITLVCIGPIVLIYVLLKRARKTFSDRKL